MINWPYMDNTNNCIEVFYDEDNNNVWDIHLTVYLHSFKSYINDPTLFDQNSNELGISVTTTDGFIDFIPLSQFEETSTQTGRFFLAPYNYSKNIAIPYVDMLFEYEVKVAYRSPSGDILNFTNPNNLFMEWANSMNPQGSVSEQAVKDICSMEIAPFDPPKIPYDGPLQGKLSSPENNEKNQKGLKGDIMFSNIQETNNFSLIGHSQSVIANDFTLNYLVPYSQQIYITIFSLEGKVIYSNNNYLAKGSHQKTINISSFPKGIYFCRSQSKNNLETIRLFKTE